MSASTAGTAPATGREITQSDTVSQGLEAVDQVRAAASALGSVGISLSLPLPGAELQRLYRQWDDLDFGRLAAASELLDSTRTGVGELRVHADSTAGRLSVAWPDKAGEAAYGNYRRAASRAASDVGEVGKLSRAVTAYQETLAELLTSMRQQAELILANLIASLGQCRNTGAIVQDVAGIRNAADQPSAARGAQNLVDGLRQQLLSRVAVPTEYAAAQLQQLFTMIQQQATTATDLLDNVFQGIDVAPYAVPEFPAACEPDRPKDCGCEDEEQQDQGPAPAAAGAGAPAAGGAGSVGGSADGPGSGSGSSGEGSDAGKAAADDSDDDSGSGSASDLGLLGDIASVIEDAISGVAGAAGQLSSGLAGAVGSGLGASGPALGGTDFSTLGGDGEFVEDGEFDSTAGLPDGSAMSSVDGGVVVQPGDGFSPTGSIGRAEPAPVVPSAQGGHGEFEVESNELQVPAPKEESPAGSQACLVPATTPVSAGPSAVPSF